MYGPNSQVISYKNSNANSTPNFLSIHVSHEILN